MNKKHSPQKSLENKTQILIIGGGRMGKKLKEVLKNYKPIIWDINPQKSDSNKTLEAEIKNAYIIFICAPAAAFEELIHKIKNYIKKYSIVISLSKGVSSKGEFTARIMEKNLPRNNYGIMAGPIMAEEIKENKPTIAHLALKDNSEFLKIKKLFENSPIRVLNHPRVIDLAVAGALKNVYALFLGIIDGLNLGENAKAYFLIKSLREMKILAKKFKAKINIIDSISGGGDLVLTAYSKFSDNRLAGEKIAKGIPPSPCEATHTIKSLTFKIKNKEKLPIFSALREIIIKKKNAWDIIKNILPN